MILIIVISFIFHVAARDWYKEADVIDDLLIKSDMEFYLRAIERIVEYISEHKYFVDFNLSFGVFMIKANSRSVLQLSQRTLVDIHRARLEWLVEETDAILDYFSNMLHSSTIYFDRSEMETYPKLVSLYMGNYTVWPAQLPKFHAELLEKTRFYTRKQLERIYYIWPKYITMVDYDRLYGPVLSIMDTCLASLAQNPLHSVHCHVPYRCIEAILKGADYGYSAPHRVIFFLLAKFGRGCNVISPEEDKKIMDGLLVKMYSEADYLALHGHKFADLMLEIIGIGSLAGHAQFMRQSWLEELLEYQHDVGCFGRIRPKEVNLNNNILIRDGKYSINNRIVQHSLDESVHCEPHITTVASIAYSSAIRFIAEMEKKTNNINISITLPPVENFTSTYNITSKFK